MPGRYLLVDGIFGRQTEAWVKEFQRRTGLSQTGVVNRTTLTKLRQYGYNY
jgi:peptidoglycan hydrolase-like protein with peptidoglycan-binding domain